MTSHCQSISLICRRQASRLLLCLQNSGVQDASTASNDCDPVRSPSHLPPLPCFMTRDLQDTLVYSCICGNCSTPNAANFSQTIPFFECQEYGNQCVDAYGVVNTPCQSACRVDNPCGAQKPTRVKITISSAML
ncbi:hypothetical protein BJ878DRAFT_524340 [Calycina marina]|uniref:DUF7707 domain-containing protein n=1 Tax=Calycina marina TaxID=1763456 RepID=A0A9P8CBA2_9HELO|nr:hypothetical protein BJ878DRAFT_524340 [Calycina marina]